MTIPALASHHLLACGFYVSPGRRLLCLSIAIAAAVLVTKLLPKAKSPLEKVFKVIVGIAVFVAVGIVGMIYA